jgi:predicted dehydrogenase
VESQSDISVDPVAVGVLGVGSLGFHHARIMQQLPEADLVGICDIDSKRAAKVASELETRAFDDITELLDRVEAVTVVVPTRSHFEVAALALEHGCDLLIEKPITPTTAEADELIRIAAQQDRIIQVGHIERFNGAVRACEPYLENPLFIESHRLAPFVRRGTDVPVVLDLMIHDIDLILSLVRGSVVDVHAVGVSVLSGSVDIANARLEFDGGAVANITASRVSVQRQRKIRFFQPSGYISLDLGSSSGEFYRRKKEISHVDEVTALSDLVEHIPLRGDGEEPLKLELQTFVRAVRRKEPVAVSAQDGRTALAVALDIVEHIERHRDNVFDKAQA